MHEGTYSPSTISSPSHVYPIPGVLTKSCVPISGVLTKSGVPIPGRAHKVMCTHTWCAHVGRPSLGVHCPITLLLDVPSHSLSVHLDWVRGMGFQAICTTAGVLGGKHHVLACSGWLCSPPLTLAASCILSVLPYFKEISPGGRKKQEIRPPLSWCNGC